MWYCCLSVLLCTKLQMRTWFCTSPFGHQVVPECISGPKSKLSGFFLYCHWGVETHLEKEEKHGFSRNCRSIRLMYSHVCWPCRFLDILLGIKNTCLERTLSLWIRRCHINVSPNWIRLLTVNNMSFLTSVITFVLFLFFSGFSDDVYPPSGYNRTHYLLLYEQDGASRNLGLVYSWCSRYLLRSKYISFHFLWPVRFSPLVSFVFRWLEINSKWNLLCGLCESHTLVLLCLHKTPTGTL